MAERQAVGLFVMIGADPCTREGCGEAAPQPFNIFQTTLPVSSPWGDVRSGSVKRVASAVGEGTARGRERSTSLKRYESGKPHEHRYP